MPRSQQPGAERQTFRQYFSATPVVGTTIEIINASASGVIVKIRKFRLYSLLANQVKVTRTSAAATGGTSSAGTISRADPVGAPVATTKIYTVAPTAGTLDANWDIAEIPAAGERNEETIESRPGLVIPATYQAAIAFTVATNTEGYVEWTEEPA